MRTLFTYGPGIPRYLGLWLVLTPVLVAGLLALGVRRSAVAVAVAATLPQLANHQPPGWLDFPLRWWVTVAAMAAVAAWLVVQVRPSRDSVAVVAPGGAVTATESAVDRRAAAALVLVALVLRVPLAWWDPGISDIATSTDVAVDQLLDGDNPWTVPNPDTVAGRYQYPAGTVLANLPLAAATPDRVLGEEHVGVRATVWLSEALTVLLLAWAGARLGRPRGGLAAAFAYAVAPMVVRDAGLTVANDLLVTALAAGAAVALARRRLVAAGVLVGVAVAVKPVALVLLPLLLLAGGWRPALAAVAVPGLLQLPFLLWPSPGLHGLEAMLEPVARDQPLAVLRPSTWWPLYATAGGSRAVVRVASLAGIAVALAAAAWAGRRLRGASLATAAAAVALPLQVAFALSHLAHLNYEGWYLAPFLLAVGLGAGERRPLPAPAREPVAAVAR